MSRIEDAKARRVFRNGYRGFSIGKGGENFLNDERIIMVGECVFGGIFCMIDYGQWKGFHFAVGLSVTRSRTSVLGLTYVV